MRVLAAALAALPLASAQEPVASPRDASSPASPGVRYAVSNEWEVGYRSVTVAGDANLYRASVNYADGLRLFSGQLRLDSLDGGGPLDRLSLRSSGAPSDPYQAHVLSAERDGVFRYDMRYRLHLYHNRLLTLWRGEHGLRTERAMQSHDLTLRPGSRFEVLLGYDHNSRTGPGFASEGIADSFAGFDSGRFLRFRTDVQQRSAIYRGGLSARLPGVALTVLHSVDLYEEGGESVDASRLPSLARNIQPVESFSRREPFHGRTPFTTVALATPQQRRVAVQARFVHSGGFRNSRLLENLSVPDPAASAVTLRDTLVVGAADRTQGSGDVTVALIPATGLTVTNTTSFHNTRINGQAALLETGLYDNSVVRGEHLAIRRLSNAVEGSARVAKRISVYGAHRYSVRRLRNREETEFDGFSFGNDLVAVRNAVHAVAGGARWVAGAGTRASVEIEMGRADRPLATIAERRFRNESVQVRWRRKLLSAGGFFRRRLNDNPTEFVAYSSRSRATGLYGSYADPKSGVVWDASYTLLRLYSSAGILNLFELDGDERGRSAYLSRIHSLQFGLSAPLHSRLALSAGFSLTSDLGPGKKGGAEISVPGFVRDGSLVTAGRPMTYLTPRSRVSVALRENVALNLGWQFYRFLERLGTDLGYRAHTAYTSLTVTF